tara:strand:+ start:151 stop:438 length:288 start_codon:yes stop_codon:yes gene_type:complete
MNTSQESSPVLASWYVINVQAELAVTIEGPHGFRPYVLTLVLDACGNWEALSAEFRPEGAADFEEVDYRHLAALDLQHEFLDELLVQAGRPLVDF